MERERRIERQRVGTAFRLIDSIFIIFFRYHRIDGFSNGPSCHPHNPIHKMAADFKEALMTKSLNCLLTIGQHIYRSSKFLPFLFFIWLEYLNTFTFNKTVTYFTKLCPSRKVSREKKTFPSWCYRFCITISVAWIILLLLLFFQTFISFNVIQNDQNTSATHLTKRDVRL